MTAIEILEEEIKENVEWLETSEGDEHQCITIENLEGILTRFFEKKVNLKIK
jgi:hypothetical protein